MNNASLDLDVARPRRRAVQNLRKLSFAASDGDFLGTEGELVALLRVSRATFREAARLLAEEKLLEVRSGAQGGYYARRPDGSSVARSAAALLRFKQATLGDALLAAYELWCVAVKRACSETDPLGAEALRELVEELEAHPEVPLGSAARMGEHVERRYRQIIGGMVGNPILSLMYDVVTRFLAMDPTALALMSDAPVVQARRTALVHLGRAILARDADAAIKIMQQQFAAYLQMIPAASLTRSLELDSSSEITFGDRRG